jgi:hypothetical protein
MRYLRARRSDRLYRVERLALIARHTSVRFDEINQQRFMGVIQYFRKLDRWLFLGQRAAIAALSY